ncbi:MAG: hypothetical protein E7605_06415 [Ruminococcaceae bacterium]|nr:hypothetical protein [Oscillospiraceae bacterium]
MAESTWNDICKSVGGFAKKAGRKAEELTEAAAIRLKISAKKADLEDAYLALGKLAYEQANAEPDADTSEVDVRFAAKLADVSALLDDIAQLEKKIAKDA